MPASQARMVLLLLPLLLILGRFWQPTVGQKMVSGDQNLTSNSLTHEDEALTLYYLLPPAWGLGALFRGRKPDTG